MYQQNAPFKQAFPPREYTQRGHFLACARIFGPDAAAARRILAGSGHADFAGGSEAPGQVGIANNSTAYSQTDELELAPSDIALLAGELPHALVAIGLGVVEKRPDGRVLRELDARFTTPSLFSTADLQVDTM